MHVINVWMHPEVVLQLSVVHGLPSSQFTAVLLHPVLGLQTSFVQALLSLHDTLAKFTQPVRPHESLVHMLLSLHDVGAAGLHAPAPLQNRCGVKVLLEHIAAPHDVVFGACWQAPLWHRPVLPHGGAAAHRLCGSMSPFGTFLHVPLPSTLQAWQVVPQLAVPQQTPSVQKFPVRQSEVAVQAVPSGFLLPHIPVMTSQIVGGLQSALLVQAVLQAMELQA